MAYAWRRAVRAIAVTSSTTSVAFMANIFSPLMPIKAFGVFAGLIIPVNYIMMIFIFPPAVIFYENKLKNASCCKKRNDDKVEAFNQDDILIKEISAFERIENFFGNTWNNMVFKGRYIILVTFLIWIGFASVFAA
jgi:predicted RND superfamily exporter protein